MDELFKGRHFEREIIVLCVRWYLRFKLSLRDLVEMMGAYPRACVAAAGSNRFVVGDRDYEAEDLPNGGHAINC